MSEVIKMKDIIAWCDKQVEEGKLLELCWEGGGDSGWVFFEVDGESADGEEISALVDMMYTELDYGSWAGEFSANGRAEYNSKTKCFDGIDYYSEDDWDTKKFDEPIQVFVPQSLGFDSIEFHLSGNFEDEFSVDISFHIINGFITPELRELEQEMSEYIKSKITDLFDKIDVNYFNENKLIERLEMKTQNDSFIFEISEIEYSTYETTENDICIDLQERLENENQDE
jgi:hypothetical protein